MAGLIRPAAAASVKHFKRLFTSREYRKFNFMAFKFSFKKRHQKFKCKLDGMNLSIPDYMSFLYQYEEIFVNRAYEFPASEAPKILDIGSNLGLSVLFYKTAFPNAQVDAYEPDPSVFCCLQENINNNGLESVRAHNKAVWVENGQMSFSGSGADDGCLTDEGGENSISVETVDIRELLQADTYDFVKMDIEGAEKTVIPHCGDLLSGHKRIFIEYHCKKDEEQKLGTILKILEDAGFRVSVHQVYATSLPFIRSEERNGFEMQLNIFAFRP